MNVKPIARIEPLTFRLFSAISVTNHHPGGRSSRRVKFSNSIHSILNQNLQTLFVSFVRWHRSISAICLQTVVGGVPPSIGGSIQLCLEIGQPSTDIGRIRRVGRRLGRFGRFLAIYFEEAFHRCCGWM